MMELQAALQRDEFKDLDDAAALAHGNESVVIGGDSSLWSYLGVAERFGVEAAEGLHAAILGAGLVAGADAYVSRGIDLSTTSAQSNLDAIATAVPALAQLCGALKEIGITHGTRWALLGVEQPTLETIAAARLAIANEAALQAFSTLTQSVVAQWREGTISSLAEAKALIANG